MPNGWNRIPQREDRRASSVFFLFSASQSNWTDQCTATTTRATAAQHHLITFITHQSDFWILKLTNYFRGYVTIFEIFRPHHHSVPSHFILFSVFCWYNGAFIRLVVHSTSGTQMPSEGQTAQPSPATVLHHVWCFYCPFLKKKDCLTTCY